MKHSLWLKWEKIFRIIVGASLLKDDPDSLFYISKHKHMGRTIKVENDKIKFMDEVIELHLNNKMIQDILSKDDNIIKYMIKLSKILKYSLELLAQEIKNEEYKKCKYIIGTSLINRGIEKFGFKTYMIKNRILAWYLRWYMLKLLKKFNPDAKNIINKKSEQLIPKLIIISKEELEKRYGGDEYR